MTQKREVYVCEICGNQVEILRAGAGILVCCGQKMTLQQPNTQEASQEKHIPDLTQKDQKLHVQIGSDPHPMEEPHHIEWIEVLEDNRVERVELQPGEKPAADFCVKDAPNVVRAYCNLHGLWQKEPSKKAGATPLSHDEREGRPKS